MQIVLIIEKNPGEDTKIAKNINKMNHYKRVLTR